VYALCRKAYTCELEYNFQLESGCSDFSRKTFCSGLLLNTSRRRIVHENLLQRTLKTTFCSELPLEDLKEDIFFIQNTSEDHKENVCSRSTSEDLNKDILFKISSKDLHVCDACMRMRLGEFLLITWLFKLELEGP
jgi:hypothetical protein